MYVKTSDLTAVYNIVKQPSRMITRPDKVVIIYGLSKRSTRHHALFIASTSRPIAMTIVVNAEEDTVLE
jgi:hypothetical protein